MNFGAIVDKIGQRTKRPDKEDDIKDAINDAIEYTTVNGDWENDTVEGSLTIDGTVYSQSLVISTSFERFRKIKYLRPTAYKKVLDHCDPTRVFDENGRERLDVWYRAGDNLVFKLSTLVTSMLYGYLQYPERMDAETDEHWMLNEMYTAIFNLACADIWDAIGNSEEATRIRAIANNMIISHRRDRNAV